MQPTSEQLADFKAFLIDWIKWVDDGAERGKPYLDHAGLCNSFVCGGVYPRLGRIWIYDWMPSQHGGNKYPFGHRCDGPRNPERVAWARKMVGEL